MRNAILFDDDVRDDLLPLTFTRPVCELRVGILTISEKWQKALNCRVSHITSDYLSPRFPINIEEENYIINGAVLPNDRLLKLVDQLELNEALLKNGDLIAARMKKDQFDHLINNDFIEEIIGYELSDTPYIKIERPWDIFKFNRAAIEFDFELLTKGRQSQELSATNNVRAADNIFVEENAYVEASILNAASGPIYIGKGVKIMEGSIIRGPVAFCDHATIKMGAKIYGSTTIGPWCKVGGEVKNSVLTGYSNKGHEGYLGDSVLGEWCNLGADTNVSNMKNNYAQVKVWNYPTSSFANTGLQFCGLIMGDHSKTGINTMFNTGTVVGVSCNIFGSGYPRNFIPSFSWGGASGYKNYQFNKAIEVARSVMDRRDIELTEADVNILQSVYDISDSFRHYS